jgi:DtxR family Mn-dependent transcriptional regulator
VHDLLEEVLEEIWTLREEGRHDVKSLAEGVGPRLEETPLESLLHQGVRLRLLRLEEGEIQLTEEGEEQARGIIRRHRLAETLFLHVLELPEGEAEESACELEHQLSRTAVNAVCSFLGHPPYSPEGKPIPRGECCRRFTGKMQPLIVPLSEVAPGQQVRISYISTGDVQVIDRLGSLGVAPGVRCRLRRRRPAPVLQVGETMVAIDRKLVGHIFVRLEEPGPDMPA